MVLELDNIYKSFGDKHVLNGLSLRAESGKAFGLLGRNGAGKTTALRILMNVFPADSGSITIDGAPIDYRTVGIGYLPEERGLYPKKVIVDQLAYFAELKGLTHKAAVAAVDGWLERLGMTEYRGKRLDTLSKGNQQKIQLITALAHDPQIIILDEPFSGLDPVNAMLLKDVVKEQMKLGKLVLFSSHQMNYIEEFCNNIAILGGGKVALGGELRTIKKNYARDRLTVRCDFPEKIAADLGEACSLGEDGTLTIKLNGEDEKRAMMKRLVSDYDLDEVKVFEPTLADIFVKYAGGTEDGVAK